MNDLRYLSQRELYDLFTGLRGPDIDRDPLLELKYLVTARLRAIVFSYNDCITGLFVDYLFTYEDLDRLKTSLAHCVVEDFHFLCHLKCAVHATMNHSVWGPFGSRIHELLEERVAALSIL